MIHVEIYFDISGKPINHISTWEEELEEFYGEKIDFLGEEDGDEISSSLFY